MRSNSRKVPVINNKVRFCFYRDYQRYTGGHQKFKDYMQHIAELPNVECHLYSKNTCDVMPNLFSSVPNVVIDETYEPEKADVVFLAGMDWNAYLPKRTEGQQVVNLIQHVRHGDKKNPLFKFLQYEALRICVSEEVRQAILPYANGDCVTITMGHTIPVLDADKQWDLYILGKKNPTFANRIKAWAKKQGIVVKADIGLVERDAVFDNLSKAKVALVLPNPTEGFFLPGIEAMGLSERVVVPDCVGNRGYCAPYTNITLCNYEENDCTKAISNALERLSTPLHKYEKFRGNRKARSYSIDAERRELQRLMLDRNLA